MIISTRSGLVQETENISDFFFIALYAEKNFQIDAVYAILRSAVKTIVALVCVHVFIYTC